MRNNMRIEDSINSKYELSKKDIEDIDAEIIKEQWVIIYNFFENGNFQSYEDLQSGMDALYILCTETRFLDKSRCFLNKGNGLRGNNGIFGIMKEYIETEYCNNPEVKKKGKELLVKPKDIDDQFYFSKDDKRPRSELLANMMLLSDSMAHVIDTNDISKMFTEEGQESRSQLSKVFYKIKHKCMDELVKCKQNGEDIFIEKINYDGRDTCLVAIPGYFEPFCIYLDDEKVNLDEYDDLQYFNYSISKMDMLITTFPLKLSQKKDSIIREHMDPNRTQPKELRGIRDRLLWYINTQDRFEEIKRKKGKMQQETEIAEDKKERDDIEFVLPAETDSEVKEEMPSQLGQNKGRPKKRNKRPEKTEKFKEINRDFLEKLNEQLGEIISPTMISKFLQRASYSFEALINGKLKAIATPFFEDKNLDESQINNELLKIFIYIRMFSRISVINNSRIDNESSIEAVRTAFENYEDVFEFMQKNKDKNLSYDDMQKGIIEYLENRGEREEKEEQLYETQDAITTDSEENNDLNQIPGESKQTQQEETESEKLGYGEEEIEAEDYERKEESEVKEFETEEKIGTEDFETTEKFGVKEIESDNGKIENEANSKSKEQGFNELKKATESIVAAKEIKSLSEDSIDVLKRRKKEIKQLIIQNEEQIDEAMLSGESQEIILEQVKTLRELIKEQKVLRKEIKRKIKQFKLQKKQAKNNIKESQGQRGEAIDRL